jgi:tetratricopeptide (TPR) repeat protein
MLLRALVREDTAESVAAGSPAYKKYLEEASQQYEEIHSKYRLLLVGPYSRMYQGRIKRKLKQFDDALSLFGDLIAEEDERPEYRLLKTKTMIEAMPCWLDPSQKKYAQACDTVRPWLAAARGKEASDPDWVQLKLELARALKLYGEAQQASDGKEPTAESLFRESKKLAGEVAKLPGDMQRDARALLATLPGSTAEEPGDDVQYKTFTEARDAGKEALDAMQTASFTIGILPKRIAQEKDPGRKQEMQQQLEEAQQAVPVMRDKSLRAFRAAVRMARPDTPVDDLNVVRYFLCYLNYTRGDYLDAAVIGQFVSRHYPDSAGGKQCAKIAMAAYLKLYSESQEEDKQFEAQRIIEVADYIAGRWPEEPEAAEALSTLIVFMIRDGKLDDAVEYLQSIPVDSPKRGTSELKTGQAMWSSYRRGVLELQRWEADGPPAGVDPAAREKELEQLKQLAEKILTDGVTRMKGTGVIDETMVSAVLSLSQIYIDTGEPVKAVALLEDEKVGALTLVDTKNPAAQGEGIPEEIYRTALRAYISSLGSGDPSQSEKMLQNAERVMRVLSEQMDQEKLSNTYIKLARDLQESIEVARAGAKDAQMKGLGIFLQKVAAESNDFSVLNWVAETYYNLGSERDKGQGAVDQQAKEYFKLASDTYAKMLSASIPDRYRTTIQVRLAMTQKRVGDYDAAVKTFLNILKDNNLLLNVQMDAAMTLHQWGVNAKDPQRLESAIRGMQYDSKLRKGIIWGWIQISNSTARQQRFQKTFYQARYNLALSRLELARAQSGDQKHETLLQAKKDIVLTEQLFPLGDETSGSDLEAEFDKLLKRIQSELKERPTGLEGIRAA